MKKFCVLFVLGILVALVAISTHHFLTKPGPQAAGYKFGDPVGELNGVKIYYNGRVGTTKGRHLAADGYNFGLRYQCVEFVKRYYYEGLGHRMPDTWGHAKDFFDASVADGGVNEIRALRQFRNGGSSKPEANDLIIFGPTEFNPYGHVAIVSRVGEEDLEIAQQNPGPQGKPRVRIGLQLKDGVWRVNSDRVLGWLRVPEAS